MGAIAPFLSVLAVVVGGVFSFVKWVDLRRRELRQRRWADYQSLVAIISGKNPDGKDTQIPEQIVAVYQLLEFPEYALVSVSALKGDDEFANETWVKHVAPHKERVLRALRTTEHFKEQAAKVGLN